MRIFVLLITLSALGSTARAQAPSAPVIYPRGVVNGITMAPAPATIARGGIININGLNLGPFAGVKASGLPLPSTLGNPAVQVLINGSAVPLFSISSSLIVAQVPWDASLGSAQVVVSSAGVQSSPAGFTISAEAPAVRTADGSGYGTAGTASGQTLTLSATGLGATNPAVSSGAAGTANSAVQPVDPVLAYVGGLPATATATLSTQRVGEFDVQIALPSNARAGDAITLQVNGATGLLSANRSIYQGLQSANVQYIPLPSGTPPLQTLTSSDLDGNYVIGAAPGDAQGCSAAFVFDMVAGTANKASDCLLSSNLGPPVVAATDGNVLGALVGPSLAASSLGTGGSSQAILFNPMLSAPLNISLPSAATSLLSTNGTLAAIMSGSTPQLLPIDSQTGTVGSPLSFGAGLGGAAFLTLNVNIDGLSHILSAPTSLPQGQIAVIVGDDDSQPTRAEFVVLDQSGNTVLSKSFPTGWLPLVAPQATDGVGSGFPGGGPGGGVPPGGGFPGGGFPVGAPPGGGGAGFSVGARESSYYDSAGGVLYALAHAADNSVHGYVSFALDATPAATISFPSGVYAAACSTTISLFSLTLSRRVVIAAGASRDLTYKSPCPASGFIELNLADQSISAISAPRQGQFDASPSSFGLMNDFVYGMSANSSGSASSLFVLDGASALAFRLDLPVGVLSFSSPQPVTAMSALVATATNTTTGDAGLVMFDLGNQVLNTFPAPNGFASMSLVSVFPTTRKLVAQGVTTGGSGSKFLIFDLVNGNLAVAPNPNGVAFAGSVPSAASSGAVAQSVTGNVKANTAAAIALDGAGSQVGIIVVRIP